LDSSVIQIEDVSKRYGNVQALRGINLAVSSGELFGFLGPNGAGKTTIIRVIMGFLKADSGRVRVFGMDPWKEPQKTKSRIGFLPDGSRLYEGMTGHAFLDYMAGLHTSPATMREELCDRLEIGRRDLSRKIKGYSHGMKRKLGIIQAVQHDPDLLILDEPTQGLDPLTQKSFSEILRELKDKGTTIFFSSHILSEVEQLCERVGIIRNGSLAAVEKVNDLQGRKVRIMEIVFRGPPPTDISLQGVEILDRNDRSWRLVVRGDVNPVLQKIAQYELEDLIFERPPLEDIFLDYYR